MHAKGEVSCLGGFKWLAMHRLRCVITRSCDMALGVMLPLCASLYASSYYVRLICEHVGMLVAAKLCCKQLNCMHSALQVNAGINVRKGTVSNMHDENVVQPLLVSTSAISLAAECVRMILKIDDIVITR